ncbi:hypothetical protein ETD96_28795 [Actinomadura geliboluensis]|uniref:Uncharacterized protein n=1 Tax=Actinomadura geliboluensis TaxID=882440 RepID=A0A5S4GIL1_9ACTN|nr:hypothetical protein ETD96_28795 [Actinomadura geliboluensis]
MFDQQEDLRACGVCRLHQHPVVSVSRANARLTFHGRCLLVRRVVFDGRPVAHVAVGLGVSR